MRMYQSCKRVGIGSYEFPVSHRSKYTSINASNSGSDGVKTKARRLGPQILGCAAFQETRLAVEEWVTVSKHYPTNVVVLEEVKFHKQVLRDTNLYCESSRNSLSGYVYHSSPIEFLERSVAVYDAISRKPHAQSPDSHLELLESKLQVTHVNTT